MPSPPAPLSRKQIDRAGQTLASPDSSLSQLRAASAVLEEWRRRHELPMFEISRLLRDHVSRVEITAPVVQRLKREVSIAAKLRRPNPTSLSRMQDLVGVRVVVSDMQRLRQLEGSITVDAFPHPLARTDDYIAHPKKSGYRSLHLVHRFASPAIPESHGLQVEIQLRTALQHAWATALETVEFFQQSALKANDGPEEWLEFFRLAGAALALLEECPVSEDYAGRDAASIFAETTDSMDDLFVIQKLRSYSRVVKSLSGFDGDSTRFLLELDIAGATTRVRPFGEGEHELARQAYLEAEALARSLGTQVVLVEAASGEILRETFPNWFLQTDRFVELLNTVRERAGVSPVMAAP